MTIEFTVLGHPEPAGSKTAYAVRNKKGEVVKRANGAPVVVVTDANKRAKHWQRAVAEAAREAYQGDLLEGPLDVTFLFYRPRPKGHYRTGKNAGKLRTNAPACPTGAPDVLKLARGVEDALTGQLWRDDAQIVDERIRKFYGEPERCEVQVYQVEQMPLVGAAHGD